MASLFSRSASSKRRPRRRLRAAAALATASIMATMTGCGLQTASSYVPDAEPGSITPIKNLPDDATLTVTSQNFTEQLILGKIGVLAAKAAGFHVKDQTNVPGSVATRQLMTSHKGDVTYEYTGVAWLTYMGHEKKVDGEQQQWKAIHDEDLGNGLTWLKPSRANNTYALTMGPGVAKKHKNVKKLSDIAKLPVSERTFCVESEFNSRADGFKPMLAKYGMKLGAANGVPEKYVTILDTGAVYNATAEGKCNFGEVFTTDGRIETLDLTLLADDKKFFPEYNITPYVNSAKLKQYPQMASVYNQVSAKMTNAEMMRLNRQVDVEGREPADVAYDWMVQKGFITRA